MYDIWIDLDDTIWSSRNKDGKHIWAKNLNLKSSVSCRDFLYTQNGSVCQLHDGVRDWLKANYTKHNLNVISAGGFDNTRSKEQPSYTILQMFDILPYFKNVVIGFMTMDKGSFLDMLNNPEIVFIDDDAYHIDRASNLGIYSINRKDIKWTDLNISKILLKE